VIQELRELAQRRDQMLLAKEAAYSTSRMRTRTAASHETNDNQLDVPAFLRRKTSQGKAAPETPPK
jgi:hypothetical protein